jgi:hypothetical protein
MSLQHLITPDIKSKIVSFLKKEGRRVKEIRFVNRGHYAHVFSVDDKYVLKFTSRDMDFVTWKRIAGLNIPNVAKCLGAYDIQKIQSNEETALYNYSPDGDNRNEAQPDKYYLIVQKYYERDYTYYDEGSGTIGNIIYWYLFDFTRHIVFNRNVSFEDAYNEYMNNPTREHMPEKKITDDADKKLFKKMMKQVYDGIHGLAKTGVSYYDMTDIHAHNVRFDKKDNLKIVDF